MWSKVNINDWPWNVAYLMHHSVYHNPYLAEEFAQRLYFPGLVCVVEKTLTEEEQQLFVIRFRQRQSNDITVAQAKKIIDKLATIENLKRITGQQDPNPNIEEEMDQHIQELLRKPLIETDLQPRIARLLTETRVIWYPEDSYHQIIQTVGDLIKFSKSDISKLHGIGSRYLRMIQVWLNRNGLDFNKQHQFASIYPHRRTTDPSPYHHIAQLSQNHII